MNPGAGAAVGHWGVAGQDGSAPGAGLALAAAASPGSTWSGPVVEGVSGATIRHVGCSTRSLRGAGEALSAATGAGWAAGSCAAGATGSAAATGSGSTYTGSGSA